LPPKKNLSWLRQISHSEKIVNVRGGAARIFVHRPRRRRRRNAFKLFSEYTASWEMKGLLAGEAGLELYKNQKFTRLWRADLS